MKRFLENGKLIQFILREFNCFCGMVDRRKVFSLISSRVHCQRSSPLRNSDTPGAGFEHEQNLSSGFGEWSCAVVTCFTQCLVDILHWIPTSASIRIHLVIRIYFGKEIFHEIFRKSLNWKGKLILKKDSVSHATLFICLVHSCVWKSTWICWKYIEVLNVF